MKKLKQGFKAYGALVYNWPLPILVFNLVVLLSLGYGYTLYEEAESGAHLWAPEDAQAFRDAEKIQEAFDTNFITENVYIVGKPKGANILTPEAFQELIQFQIGAWETVTYDGKTHNDICFRSAEGTNESACDTAYYPLQFFIKEDATFEEAMLDDFLNEINDGKGTIDFYPADSFNYINIKNMFGGTTPSDAQTSTSDGTNNIQQAEAIHWKFFVKEEYSSRDFLDGFEINYEDYVAAFNEESTYISVHPIMYESITRASEDAISKDTMLFVYGISMIVIYSFFVLGELNTVHSRILIALVGVVSVGLAYVETIGFASYLDIRGNAYVSVIPFLMIGIGVDDMYVLVSALKQAPTSANGQEKMMFMMKHAGVSITITSLTNLGAFAIGGITDIPVIHNFCMYAALGMFFDYFNQMTFFAALLAYDVRRSERPLGDCCGLLFCKPNAKVCCSGKYIFDKDGKPQKPLSQRCMYRVYSKWLMKTPVRIIVCVLFVCSLAVNCYSLSQFKVMFSYDWLATDDYTVYDSIQIRDEYFDDTGRILNFFSLYSEFTTREAQIQLEDLANNIESCKGCEGSWIIKGSTDSWYSNFKTWVSQDNCEDSNGAIVPIIDDYIPSVHFHECLAEFQETAEGIAYSSKLAWEDGVLVASAIEANMIDFSNTEQRTQVLGDTRDIADSGPDDTYPYSPVYLWYEHYAIFEKETLIQMSCALALVFVVIMATNADLIGGFIVLIIVSSTLIGQLATMHFWGEHLNILSMVNSVMGIGVALDFSAHFLYAFRSSRAKTNVKKARAALRDIGVSIFNGGLSTLLAILPLAAANSYVVKIFFKCWFALLLYGLAYALIAFPVILSFTGVTPQKKPEREDREKTPQPGPSEDEALEELKRFHQNPQAAPAVN